METDLELRSSPTRRRLPPDDWPEQDRLVWEAARRPVGLLEDGGHAAKWADNTATAVAAAYGRWIGWLDETEPATLLQPPASRVTNLAMRAYLATLQSQVSCSSTVFYIRDLIYALEVIAPANDWHWLRQLLSRLRKGAEPARDKRARIVPIRQLYGLGIRLMQEAATAASMGDDERAIQFRDGLIIALLAVMPLRISNLATIRLHEHLQWRGQHVSMHFEPHETKTRTEMLLDIPFPLPLVPHLEKYLLVHRPALQAAGARRRHGLGQTDNLWVSGHGVAMCRRSIFGAIAARTQAEFGHPINPHLFRDCAATALQVEAPEHANIIRHILGHSTIETAQRHYSHGRITDVVDRYQSTILKRRRKPEAS